MHWFRTYLLVLLFGPPRFGLVALAVQVDPSSPKRMKSAITEPSRESVSPDCSSESMRQFCSFQGQLKLHLHQFNYTTASGMLKRKAHHQSQRALEDVIISKVYKITRLSSFITCSLLPRFSTGDEAATSSTRIAGFRIATDQMPPMAYHQATLAVAEVQERCFKEASSGLRPSKQQALRLLIGMGYDKDAAVAKWKEIATWRATNGIDDVRLQQSSLIDGTAEIHFPEELEVYSKLIKVRPCVLRAVDGSPVSIWHAGSLNAWEAGNLSSTSVTSWSHAIFEYKDLWITKKSEEQRKLLGYIQVYDMQDVSLRHLSSREITDKLKTALQAGSFYMEAVAHMYVINASQCSSLWPGRWVSFEF